MERYTVFGNPVAHSRSPQIHLAFAAQRGQILNYERTLVPYGGFPDAVGSFFARGGKGANVTLPFKEEAFALCEAASERAARAGAANTLWQQDGQLYGDNTDGIGLVTDIRGNLGWQITRKRVLVLGAGGAVRGVLGPLMEQTPAEITIANRTVEKAEALVERFTGRGVALYATPLEPLRGQYDLIINAISAGLQGDALTLPETVMAPDCACYDMLYGDRRTPFLQWAQEAGAVTLADGLGMLVEQAAEAFRLWHHWQPDTRPVIAMLRRS